MALKNTSSKYLIMYLQEELGDGGRHRRHHHDRYLPPLTPRDDIRSAQPIFAFGEHFNKTGNTKKGITTITSVFYIALVLRIL